MQGRRFNQAPAIGSILLEDLCTFYDFQFPSVLRVLSRLEKALSDASVSIETRIPCTIVIENLGKDGLEARVRIGQPCGVKKLRARPIDPLGLIRHLASRRRETRRHLSVHAS